MKNLTIRTEATNELNRLMVEELKNLLPQLEKYKGIKVKNADGTTCKKTPINFIKPEPKQFNSWVKLHVDYLDFSNYSLWFKMSICTPSGDGHSCVYFDKTVYVGELENGQIIKKINSLDEIAKDWDLITPINADEEAAKVEQYKTLTEQARKIKKQFTPKSRRIRTKISGLSEVTPRNRGESVVSSPCF